MRSVAAAFLVGVVLVHQLAALPSLWWGVLLLLPLAAAARWRPLWLIPFFFVAGIVWTALRGGLILADSLPPALEGEDVVVEGHVVDLPRPADYGQRFLFDVTRAERHGVSVAIPRRIQLSVRETKAEPDSAASFRPGSYWRFTARLTRPHGFANPGGFDYEAHLFRQRIRARGYVRDDPPPRQLTAFSAARFIYRVDRAREQIGSRLRAALADSPRAGILVALANGDQGGIDAAQWQVLRRTGTLHLVAISGLHISLVAGLVFFIARFAWALPGRTVLWAPAPVVGAIAGLVAALIYAALAGFTIPTQRALVMLAVAMGAILLRRRFAASWLLAAALLAVLLHDPFAVMAPGFWLSFVAVAVIVFVMHGEQTLQNWWRRWGYLQLAIALGMLPVMVWLFQQTSLVAPFANLIAVPMFDVLIVPLTLLAVGTQWLISDALGALLLQLANWLLGLLWFVLEAMNRVSWAQWVQHAPSGWTVATAVIGVMVLLAPRGWPARWVGVVWIAPLLFARAPAPLPGEVHFTLLDVGQGLAAVVRTTSYTLVYDTGARFSSRFDAGAAVVAPYLQAKGIGRIDLLVISHGDNDHIGGMESLRSTIPVAAMLSNVTAPALGASACRRGMMWARDGVRFSVLGPGSAHNPRSNDGSCVLHIAGRFGSILLPGDIEKRAERALLKQDAQRLRATILVAPHHGSKTSSSTEFIGAVAPAHVLFAAGYRSRYGHPHRVVVQRYTERGIATHDSASSGAMEFVLGADGIGQRMYRQERRRFWRTH